jgi:hypothetical protein
VGLFEPVAALRFRQTLSCPVWVLQAIPRASRKENTHSKGFVVLVFDEIDCNWTPLLAIKLAPVDATSLADSASDCFDLMVG